VKKNPYPKVSLLVMGRKLTCTVTRITLRFVSLVYKFVEQMKNPRSKKQAARTRLANSPALSRCSIGSSQSELIDLTGDLNDLTANDDSYMQQGLILTPAPSAPTSRPTSSHADHSSQPPHAHQVVDQTTATGSPAPPMSPAVLPTPPAYSPPVVSCAPFLNARISAADTYVGSCAAHS
jgi:hypothetical protein